MIYEHKNNKLDVRGRIGHLYVNQHLLFVGDSYKAILMFIKFSNNNKNVLNKFRNQLEQREECKLKKLNSVENE